MIKCAFFFDGVIGRPSKFFEFSKKAFAEEEIELICVARYKFELFKKEYSDIKGYFLYDHFTDINEEDIPKLEKKISIPFNTIRMMSKVAALRFPNMKKLPDNKYFANCVKSWIEFFEKEKPDFFLTGLIDEYPGTIGLEVAKSLRIPVIILVSGRLSNSFVLLDENYALIQYRQLTKEEILECYEKAKSMILGERIANEKMGEIVRRGYNFFSIFTIFRLARSFFRNFKSYYILLPAEDRKLWYSSFELIVRQTKYFIRSLLSRLFFSYEPKKDEKYMFFPLHYTEDASITVRAPIIDQFKLIEEISKTIPCDTVLYVKPHPHWKCSDVPLRRAWRLRKLPNVKLLKVESDTKELIKNSECVIIINSSTGFEALAIGKKVVSFGKDYPEDIIPRFKSFEDMYNVGNIKFDEEKAKNFVGTYYAHAIFPQVPYHIVSDFTEYEDVRKIAREIKNAYLFLKSNNNKK